MKITMVALILLLTGCTPHVSLWDTCKDYSGEHLNLCIANYQAEESRRASNIQRYRAVIDGARFGSEQMRPQY